MDTLGNILNVKFLGYAHWFMYIIISQIRYHYISLDQARYATSIVENYLDTATRKENPNFHNNTLTHDMILTK